MRGFRVDPTRAPFSGSPFFFLRSIPAIRSSQRVLPDDCASPSPCFTADFLALSHGANLDDPPRLQDPNSSTSSSSRIDALHGVIEPVLRAHGVEAVEVTLNREQGGWVLRVTIEVPGRTDPGAGVTLAMCADVSRDVARGLDVADIIEHAYNLEVTSPGVERPLRTAAEFTRFAGQPAKVVLLKAAADGQKALRGVIEKVDGEQVTLNADGKTVTFSVPDVKHAHLVFEFGAVSPKGSKPGKTSKPGKKKSDAGSAGSGAKAPARQQKGDAADASARPAKAK